MRARAPGSQRLTEQTQACKKIRDYIRDYVNKVLLAVYQQQYAQRVDELAGANTSKTREEHAADVLRAMRNGMDDVVIWQRVVVTVCHGKRPNPVQQATLQAAVR